MLTEQFIQLYHRPIADFFREAIAGAEDVFTAGRDDESVKKPDRELLFELVSLAIEAHNRGLISKAKLVEIGQLLTIDRKDMLELARI